jgi:hypothetical protein
MKSTAKACSRAYGVAMKRVNPNEVEVVKKRATQSQRYNKKNGDSLKKMYPK